MKITWLVVASLMTSCCVFCAPSVPEHGRKPDSPSGVHGNIRDELEEAVELKERLMLIVKKAEVEFRVMEILSEAFHFEDGLPSPSRLTPEQLLLLKAKRDRAGLTSRDVDFSKLFLDEKLIEDSSLTLEHLLLLQKAMSRRGDDLSSESSEQSDPEEVDEAPAPAQPSDSGEPSTEQKFLEAKLFQRVVLSHEELLRLAELRALRSGSTTLKELCILHKITSSLTPEKILMTKTLTPMQLLKYFFLPNSGGSTLGRGLLGSLIQHLSGLAHTKEVLEHNELLLFNLLKNHQPREGRIGLSELALIYRYQESMSHSLQRSNFFLKLYLTNMTNGMGIGEILNDHEKLFAATLLERIRQQRNGMWEKEEEILLRRYRQGKASLMGTVLAYRELDAMTNSGIGSDLRSYVMNAVRTNMMNGSGIAMMNNGTWMKGWMNDTEFMTASDTERSNELWDLYKLRYIRNHGDRDEERNRRRIFEAKVCEIVKHNIEVKLDRAFYTMGLNNLSDWTQEELSTLKGYKPLTETDSAAQSSDVIEGETARAVIPSMPYYTNTVPTTDLPAAVNWSSTNWVGPVQNQYQCGSCWAFSASGSLEAQYYNKTQTFVTLSEQNLIDCTYYLGNLGCSGGNVVLAYDYVMTVGIDTYAAYPYTGRYNNGTCMYNAANSVTQDNGWMYIPSGDEVALQQAVALVGPVSAAIDASQSSFDSYVGGVYSSVNCSSTELDHAILVVGYGTTSEGQDYWLIKNSWGVDWGINGYMMMERNVNMCGIATQAIFPIIN